MLFDDTYKTIAAPSEGTYRDRGSRFIGYAYPVTSTDEIANIISSLKKEHHSARHHCYAWRIGPQGDSFRSNDDGEPSGTAGKPIMNQVLSAGLTNVLIVVVRYFGGTLLGVSGLINAYKSAAIACLSNAQVVEKQITEVYKLEFQYDAMNSVMKILKDYDLPQSNQKFELECELEFAVRKSEAESVIALLKQIQSVQVTWVMTT